MGGIEIVMLNIGTELVKRGHDVTVLTLNAFDSKRSALRSTENIDGIHVKRFSFPPFPEDILFLPRLVSDMISSDFDLIHVFSIGLGLFTNTVILTAILQKRPFVATPVHHQYTKSSYGISLRKCLRLFFLEKIRPRILKRASYVTASTEFEAAFYRQHGVSNVKVIPEGIHVSRPPVESVINFKKKYDLDSKIVVSVGRITEYKRQDLLIKAFSQVLHQFPQAKLLIVGKDWGYLPTLKKTAEECNCQRNVIFTGLISDDDVSCAYESADVVAHTSYDESFVRIALEAWSHQKPIVCFDLGGPTEFIKPNMGTLVKYGDTEKMGKMILKLFLDENLSREMGENGYNAVETKYLWSKIAKEYESVYALAMHSAHAVL